MAEANKMLPRPDVSVVKALNCKIDGQHTV